MNAINPCFAFAGLPGGAEWIIIAIVGLLLFGKRLPEVGKSLGRSIVEFKKGLKGMEEDINQGMNEGDKDMLPPPDPKQESSSTAQHSTNSGEQEPVPNPK